MPGSGASPTPTTRRSTCAWTPASSSAPPTSSTSGPSRASPRSLRRFGEERYAGGIAREIVRRRPLLDDLRAGRRDQGRDAGLGPLRRRPPGQAHLPGDPDRRQRRARLARGRAADRLGDAADRRPPRRDLLPLARGPPRQAVPRRARPGLRLPARAAGLRLRPRARSRAADPPRRRARPRGGRGQPALASPPTCAPR